jgi:hypothetical protein
VLDVKILLEEPGIPGRSALDALQTTRVMFSSIVCLLLLEKPL